jgi:hypothetical protein
MRPYFAVIKDSFREARASRVLWILLILVTVGLFALAPLGYRRTIGARFEVTDSIDWVSMLDQLEAAGKQAKVTPKGQIWQHLPAEVRQLIAKFPRVQEKFTRDDMRKFRKVVGGFDTLLDQASLYNAEAWPKVSLGKEARELLTKQEADGLEANELRRLNRLLLEATFPRIVKRSSKQSAWRETRAWLGVSARLGSSESIAWRARVQ